MNLPMKAVRYFRSALNITLGAGAVLGGSYLFSRIRETQESESRIDRMEQILEKLSEEKSAK